MPWKASDAMSLREEFVNLACAGDANVSVLCRRFGISRDVGYKWIGRFRAGGAEALADRSRRPHRSPMRSGEAIERLVAAARAAHPAWGPRKLRRWLLDQVDQGQDARIIPAPSTIGQILLRRGLIDANESPRHRPFVRFEKDHPNELWQMDFKGHFAMLDGRRCHPLTVLDDHSRYAVGLLACGDERGETVKAALVKLFERSGQPRQVLCDNGSPWGSSGGDEPYTQLSVWLMLHGIGVTHGRPRHPQTQGKDERFHRTIDAEVLRYHHPRDLPDSQHYFDDFRHVYNHVRPHEALDLATPVTRWRPSDRAYEDDPPPPQYLSTDAVRKVDAAGKISFRGRGFKVGRAFVGHHVALRAAEADGALTVLLADQVIGRLDLRRPQSPTTCWAWPPVATLPEAGPSTEESVSYVPEHVSALTPV